jgi:lysophospholipase L1-like esterase
MGSDASENGALPTIANRRKFFGNRPILTFQSDLDTLSFMKWLSCLVAACCLASAQVKTDKACPPPKDWAGLNVFGSDDAEIRPPAPNEQRVVLLGDDVMANAPFHNRGYLNRGIAGQTTPQMLVRFRQDVIRLYPKVVVIEGGLNDIGGVAGPGTEGTITENLASMTDLAKAHGIRVVIASLSPVCDCVTNQTGRRSVGRIAGINRGLQDFARQTGSVYLNYYAVLVEPRTRQMKKEFTADGFLPNAAGYAVMAPLVEKAIAEALAAKAPEGQSK